MAWAGSLRLDYTRDTLRGEPRTVLHDRHDGPLRVLTSLYPESSAVCHNVLVHPPGGLVAGDELDIDVTLGADSHALITTPGATRFYRSTGATATQRLRATLAEGARLEWLPLESIAYSGCIGENLMHFDMAPGAQMIGWDLLALGLPASGLAFERGSFTQCIDVPGRWLERGVLAAADTRLLDSPLGWAGHRAMGTLWFASADTLTNDQRESLLETARAVASNSELQRSAGATAVHDTIVVMRVLAPRIEPVMALLTSVWAAWRQAAWQMPACVPRVWRT